MTSLYWRLKHTHTHTAEEVIGTKTPHTESVEQQGGGGRSWGFTPTLIITVGQSELLIMSVDAQSSTGRLAGAEGHAQCFEYTQVT